MIGAAPGALLLGNVLRPTIENVENFRIRCICIVKVLSREKGEYHDKGKNKKLFTDAGVFNHAAARYDDCSAR